MNLENLPCHFWARAYASSSSRDIQKTACIFCSKQTRTKPSSTEILPNTHSSTHLSILSTAVTQCPSLWLGEALLPWPWIWALLYWQAFLLHVGSALGCFYCPPSLLPMQQPSAHPPFCSCMTHTAGHRHQSFKSSNSAHTSLQHVVLFWNSPFWLFFTICFHRDNRLFRTGFAGILGSGTGSSLHQ